VELKSGISVPNLWFFEDLKLYFTIKNLTNNEYYVMGGYLPAKGRDFRISISAKL
jgi:outer membrane receptor protein involved in Fe transport